MISPTDLLWIILAMFLAYIPVLCYLDLKYREVNHWIWTPMFLIGTCITVYMYIQGYYLLDTLVGTLLSILIFYVLMETDYIQGADFLFLSFITAFWIINPYPINHGMMQLIFFIDLLTIMILTSLVVLIYNIVKGNRWGLIKMMNTYPRGLPYMIPISVAFLMSLVVRI